jgi:hypothetical protein
MAKSGNTSTAQKLNMSHLFRVAARVRRRS